MRWGDASGRAASDEFERCHREALEQRVAQRQGLPGLLELRLLLGQTFFPALKFGGVGHAVSLLPVLRSNSSLWTMATNCACSRLGRGRGCPGFLLRQLGLRLVKHLLDFPARFVAQRQQPGSRVSSLVRSPYPAPSHGLQKVISRTRRPRRSVTTRSAVTP